MSKASNLVLPSTQSLSIDELRQLIILDNWSSIFSNLNCPKSRLISSWPRRRLERSWYEPDKNCHNKQQHVFNVSSWPLPFIFVGIVINSYVFDLWLLLWFWVPLSLIIFISEFEFIIALAQIFILSLLLLYHFFLLVQLYL